MLLAILRRPCLVSQWQPHGSRRWTHGTAVLGFACSVWLASGSSLGVAAIASETVSTPPTHTAIANTSNWISNSNASQDLETAEPTEEGFVPLFDGKTLEGWKGNQKVFRVVEGAIVGGNLQQSLPNNEFLRTNKTYENFELRLQFKLVGEQANAGVQFRTAEIPDHHEVIGYQADMGDGWWGCLYDESRRNKVLAGPESETRTTLVRPNEWNDYRIRCEGPRIQLWLNDHLTVDYTESDEKIARSGILALQIHSGPPAQASYRKIRIKELP